MRTLNVSLPSMQVKNWATIRRSISRCAVSRLGVMASISSMKNKHGATRYELWFRIFSTSAKETRTLASSKVSRSVFSDSPDMPDTIDGAEIEMNGKPNS